MRIGHAGRVSSPMGEGVVLNADFTLSGTWDLKTYLAKCSYQEFDDPEDIMGSSRQPKLNAAHLEVLRRSKVILEGQQASFARTASTEWLTVNNQDAASGRFMLIDLPEAVTLTDSDTAKRTDNHAGKHDFTQLAVRPVIEDGQSGGVEVSIIDPEYGNNATLGPVYFDGSRLDNASWNIQYGATIVQFKLSRQNGLQFRKLP